MIAHLEPYPAMKDSGVEWLGEVPEHWESRKLRTLLSSVTARNRVDLPLLSVVRERGVIVRDVANQKENRNFIPDDLSNYKVVREGQLAMNKMKAWQGSYGVSRHDGIVSPAYFVFDLEGVAGEFFDSAIRSKAYVPFFTQASDGVRIGQWDLSQARMREITFSVPPLPEQAAIVRYLDYVNRRVRRLVRAKRKLIALLNEQKQAIIHRAVTRGLNPDVPLKDSGVEWLGEVPEHWRLIPNRSLFRIRKVLVGARHSEYQLLSLTKKGVIVRDMTTGQGKFSNFWERSQEVRPGDLVFCLFDVDETPRTVGLSRHSGMISGDYTVMECAGQIDGRFLECFYKAMDDRKLLSPLYTGLRKRISKPLLRAAKTPIPPPSEQIDIVEYVEAAAADISTAITRANREIDLLTEYRTRLIADVVTGKLDVREAAAALPEVDPLDTEDDVDDTLEPEAEAELGDPDTIPEEARA